MQSAHHRRDVLAIDDHGEIDPGGAQRQHVNRCVAQCPQRSRHMFATGAEVRADDGDDAPAPLD